METRIPQFRIYLIQEEYAETSIQEHINNVTRFLEWASKEMHETDEMSYNDLMAYVKQERESSISTPTIINRLLSIRHYYEHLKKEGIIDKNPVKKVQIKKDARRIVTDVLEPEMLTSVYESYVQLNKQTHIQEKTAIAHQRNVVILGLMIWQGLHSGELSKMELIYIKLNEGKVYIPSTRRSKSRWLSLDARQIIALHSYIETLPVNSQFLFRCNVRNAVFSIVEEIKGINPVIQNAAHIRSSVILGWLKQHKKRTVQYMIGHKYITSTEHYEQQELSKLINQLEKHHPLS